nr:hypothetical protein [Blastococcus sp. TML/M2B]
MEKFGVRWKTVSSAACWAISGIDWMPEEPVPMTATRLPVKSTPSCGQRLVRCTSPRKRSAPSMSGCLGTDRQPVAMTWKRLVTVSPPEVRTRQRPAASSQAASSTRVPKVMSRRRS